MKNEERITLNMSMEDYGYIVNALKSIQVNLAGTNIATTRMSIDIAGSLNILERSQIVLDIWGNIDRAMIKGYVNTLNEAANDIARGKATQQTVMDIKDVASSIYKHLPEPEKESAWEELELCATDDCDYDEVLDDHEDRISELYEDVNNIKDQFKTLDNADKALHRRLQFVEDRLENVNITVLNNRIDILEERMKNLVRNVGRIENNVTNIDKDKKKLWDIVTGSDDSLDERFEGLKHTMECLIERDNEFFNKVKNVKNEYSELDKRMAALENKAKPNISCADDILKEVNNFDISSASFNVYFENKRKDDE